MISLPGVGRTDRLGTRRWTAGSTRPKRDRRQRKEQRLIRTIPRKGIRFVGAVNGPCDAQADRGRSVQPRFGLALPDRPAIAVLRSTI